MRFCAQLVTIIKKYTNKQFSTGVILGDWRAVNKEYQLAENLWFPFPLCAMKTLIRLDRWKQHQGIEEPIERVFESGDNHQGAFLEKMRLTEGAPSISFKPKAFTPLQQGDLISWHLARSVRDVFQGKVQGLEDLREAWWLLEEHPNKDWGIYDTEMLTSFCE